MVSDERPTNERPNTNTQHKQTNVCRFVSSFFSAIAIFYRLTYHSLYNFQTILYFFTGLCCG